MNQDLLRLILTMNTSHNDFVLNLLNVVKYTMFINKRPVLIREIKKSILDTIDLEFTEQEIKRAVSRGIKSGSIIEVEKDMLLLSDKEMQDIKNKDDDAFQKVILKYIKTYQIEKYNQNDIYKMVFEYVFWYMNTNIQILLSMLQSKKMGKVAENYECANEEREIINNFIDWQDEEKNVILYNIVAFAVDYCKMTVKKGNGAFNNFFVGKKFYLDANIIFRLIGINNNNRQGVTKDFIQKCKDVGINIVYTNITKNEVYSALHYNIDKLKLAADRVQVDPQKIKRIIPERELNLDLYSIYYAWAIKNNGFGHFSDFEEYLKDRFLEEVSSFSMEEVEISDKFNDQIEELSQELIAYKQSGGGDTSINPETAKIDVINLIYIRNLRSKKGVNAWDIKEYMVSADHKFAQWVLVKYPQIAPYVSLPSVWYSLILKIDGRSTDEFKSFAEFIKLRYKQEHSSMASNMLYYIASAADERFMQDKIVDKLIESNKLRIQETEDYGEAEIRSLVEAAKEDVLKQAEKKGFMDGVKEGRDSGEMEGRSKGLEEGREIGQKEEYNRVLDRLVKQCVNKWNLIFKIANVALNIVSVTSLIFLLYMLYVIFSKDANPQLSAIEQKLEEHEFLLTIISAAITLFAGILKANFKKLINIEFVKQRAIKKYADKLI